MGKSKGKTYSIGMILLKDLLLGNIPKSAPIFHRLGIAGNKPFRKKPKECPICYKNRIIGVEVMGSDSKGPLFWMCMRCEELLLRFTQRTTRKYLKNAENCWTNPNDWEDIDEYSN